VVGEEHFLKYSREWRKVVKLALGELCRLLLFQVQLEIARVMGPGSQNVAPIVPNRFVEKIIAVPRGEQKIHQIKDRLMDM